MEDKGFSGDPAPDEEPAASAGAAAAQALVEAEAYASESEAKGTAVAYEKHWKAFEVWCSMQSLCALPAAPQTVASYLALRANKGKSPVDAVLS